MFFRPKGNQNEWIAGPAQTNQYLILNDNKANIKLNKFLIRKNEELIITTKFSPTLFQAGSISGLILRISNALGTALSIFYQPAAGRSDIYGRSGKVFATGLFNTTTSEFIGNQNSDGTRAALELDKDYTYKIKGWKKTIDTQITIEQLGVIGVASAQNTRINFMVID